MGVYFCCQACSNFKFSGITLEYAFGDCISYTADYSNENIRNRVANDLLIDNLKIRYARRNGVTVAATNVIVQNTFLKDVELTLSMEQPLSLQSILNPMKYANFQK